MAETIRVQHSKNYTVIANAAIRDTRLSFKARGLHHLLLSYPDGWQINTEHLSGQSDKDGKTSVLSALKELEQLGYLIRKQIRAGGKITAYESIIRELPQSENLNPENLNPENLNPENLNPENLNPENLNPENPVHNKYLFQEVFKKEISKEESLPAKENLKEEKTQQISVIPDLKADILGKQINLSLDKVAPAAPARLDKANVVEPFGRPRKTAKEMAWEWLPDGPWKKDGQLDNDFWQWFALEWMSQFGSDIHQARANVYSHLKKDHNNLEIRWKEYSIKTKKEVALVPLPDAVLTWQPLQHQRRWEQYIHCKSLEEFYSQCSWNQAYLEYALINQSRFDWSKHLPSA